MIDIIKKDFHSTVFRISGHRMPTSGVTSGVVPFPGTGMVAENLSLSSSKSRSAPVSSLIRWLRKTGVVKIS
jgi:hypothetical protein